MNTKCHRCGEPIREDIATSGLVKTCPACHAVLQLEERVSIAPRKSSFEKASWAAAVLLTLVVVALFIVVMPSAQPSPERAISQDQPAVAPATSVLSEAEQVIAEAPTIIDLRRAHDLDENLFVFYLIENLYFRLQTEANGRNVMAELPSALTGFRSEAGLIQKRIEAESLDPLLTTLLRDFVLSVDHHGTLLTKAVRITQDAEFLANSETQQASSKAGFTAGQVMAEAHGSGASAGDALLGGLLVGGLQFWLEDQHRSSERNAAKQRLLEDVIADFDHAQSAIRASATSIALTLTEKHGWRPGEADFELTAGALQRSLTDAVRRADTGAIQAIIQDQSRLKPRNPFALRMLVQSSLLTNGPGLQSASVTDMLNCMRELVRCAEFVPESRFYARYTSDFINNAVDYALVACQKQIGGRGYITTKTDIGRFAQALCLTALHYEPVDASGETRERLMEALAYSGDHRASLAKAVEIHHLRKDSCRFNYNHACLLSIAGKPEESFNALVAALRQSSSFVRHARTDPDLEALRLAKPTVTTHLLKPRLTSEIQWGVLNDDLIVTNNSDFALTNLKVEVVAIDGGKRVVPNLALIPQLAAGQTHRFTNCMSVSRGSTVTVNFTCDEQ